MAASAESGSVTKKSPGAAESLGRMQIARNEVRRLCKSEQTCRLADGTSALFSWLSVCVIFDLKKMLFDARVLHFLVFGFLVFNIALHQWFSTGGDIFFLYHEVMILCIIYSTALEAATKSKQFRDPPVEKR